MSDTDWGVVENETLVNKYWAKFYNILYGAAKLCVPVCKRRLRKNNKSKWWNRQIDAGLFHTKKLEVPYISDYKTRFVDKFMAFKSNGRLIHRE